MLYSLEIIINTTSHARDFIISVMHVELTFKGQGQAYSYPLCVCKPEKTDQILAIVESLMCSRCDCFLIRFVVYLNV